MNQKKIKLNQLLKIEGNNSFKDLLIKMQFSRAVLSKELKMLDSLNKGPIISILKEHYSEGFFL